MKLTLLSIFALMILPTAFQMRTQFRDFGRDPRLAFSHSRKVVDVPLNEEYQENEYNDDNDVTREDEQALREFISELKKKGGKPSSGVTTWKPNVESNGLWDFKSFLNELATQSQKKKNPSRPVRMPGN